MRKPNLKTGLVVTLMAVCLVGGTAMAQVYTDPVGFVKVDVVQSGLTMVSVPLEAADKALNGAAGCLGDMIKENLTGGPSPVTADVLWKWDAATQKYETAFLVAAPGSPYDGKWFNPAAGALSTLSFNAGDAMWVDRKAGGAALETITFLGWVPMEATKSVTLVKGLTMFNWPYPTTLGLNASTLASVAQGGPSPITADVVWEWDETAGKYVSAFLVAAPGSPFDGKWFDATAGALSTITFGPGYAFWFDRKPATAATWICNRPY